jgi:hypothetical protein
MGKIRNLMQSVQEREIIKTAPDLVVYIEGLPYLKNPYLTTNPQNPVLVNFNDHVTAFNANYDMQQMIPSCTISMSVPAHLRYLYQAPGGLNLIKTMMQVQVFAKGYYFAADGNTVFRRVFKGYTSHVTHTDDGKTLMIAIQCKGILGFFEMMQVDLSPAIQSSSPQSITPLTSTLAGFSPYQMMAFTFLYPSMTDGFYVNALGTLGSAIQNTEYFEAVQDGFVAKWQTVIADICQEAHIYGLQTKDVQNVINFLSSIAQNSTVKGFKGWSFLAAEKAFYTNIKESDVGSKLIDLAKIQRLHSDLGIGSVQLLNGKPVTRLEFLRTITHLVNYECYQDIDGQIIIKPPVYNLDVTNLGSNPAPASSPPLITNANNPFVVHLAEITSEAETEDEGAVRATRMVVQGTTTAGEVQFGILDHTIRATAEFTDLPKLAQFGLREEPARTVPWFYDADTIAVFAQAAAELALANRGYRTYSFTIPLRPELKLGFPLFIPHRDMYGYVKSVGINYQYGGTATMTVTLDALRKRPMFPQPQGQGTIFVAQPNLVLKWTQGDASPSQTPSTQTFIDSLIGASVPDPNASPAVSEGSYITLPKPPTSADPTPDQKALIAFQQQTMGSYFALASDTKDASWRIQKDVNHIWSATDPTTASLFYRPVSVSADWNFYQNARTCLPYTDEKGYEVFAPFPWGRWLDVNTAIQEFTEDGYVSPPPIDANTYLIVQKSTAFIYAGLENPVSTGDNSTAMTAALQSVQKSLGVGTNSGTTQPGQTQAPTTPSTPSQTGPNTSTDITAFELSYQSFSPGGADSIIQVGTPESKLDSALISGTQAAEQQKVDMFLTGSSPQPDLTLASQVKAIGNAVQSAGQTPLTPGQFGASK